MELKADGFIKYRLINGTISDDTVEGYYNEFELKDGGKSRVDAGTWSGIRAVGQKP